MVQWLVDKFSSTRDDKNLAFQWSCQNNHLKIAQWLVKKFDLDREDAKSNNNYAFYLAYYNGHLEVVQWLVNKFNLTRDDIVPLWICALRVIHKNKTTQWLN